MTADWRWVDPAVVAALRDQQLADYGGLPGVRDQGAVKSGLARPESLAAFGDADLADLAAADAFGLPRNPSFSSASKRTAGGVARLFLRLIGAVLQFDSAEAVLVEVARGRRAGNGVGGLVALTARQRNLTRPGLLLIYGYPRRVPRQAGF